MDQVLGADKTGNTFNRLKWPTHLNPSSSSTTTITTTSMLCDNTSATTFVFYNNGVGSHT